MGLHLSGDTTPNTARRSMFSRAVNTLRHSGGKGHNRMNSAQCCHNHALMLTPATHAAFFSVILGFFAEFVNVFWGFIFFDLVCILQTISYLIACKKEKEQPNCDILI